jgi:hypothetical protein
LQNKSAAVTQAKAAFYLRHSAKRPLKKLKKGADGKHMRFKVRFAMTVTTMSGCFFAIGVTVCALLLLLT